MKVTLGLIAGLVILSAVSLRCSSHEDEKSAVPTTLQRVRGELRAGKEEYARQTAESLENQLRVVRLKIKKCLRDGKKAEARRLMNLVPQLEAAIKRHRKSSSEPTR